MAPDARARVARARAVVDALAEGEAPVYGVNTGFGNFAETRIAKSDLAALQVNLVRSHAAGVDDPLPPRTVRAMMALRANVLAKGYSGIRPVDARRAAGADQPRRASARAQPRIGRGQRRPGAPGAPGARPDRRGTDVGRRPRRGRGAGAGRRGPGRRSVLAPKEGLALINGTQASAAVLALALAGAERLARAADIIAALTHRRPARLAPPVRSAHPRAAARSPARSRPPTISGGSSTAARSTQSHAGVRPRPGRVLGTLRAAGARRGAGSAGVGATRRHGGDERRHRQPDGLRRRGRDRVRAATSMARPSRWPPICWRWR